MVFDFELPEEIKNDIKRNICEYISSIPRFVSHNDPRVDEINFGAVTMVDTLKINNTSYSKVDHYVHCPSRKDKNDI